ncbi:putative DMT superfamily transporter inner membrane protein [Planctomycetes bacterium Pla163]|uniref:Putative DMT superfamily transporter inner membrane protein n=1 Tax=Rohdeia mirabilis TaxID=2528008 RepID=A0A518CZ72_9BACT|nr:putative DMT superfamily transporter inner membrane protein [Planctomycetes bacterium Pla163]
MDPLALFAGLFSAVAWAFGSHLFARLMVRHREVGAPAANLYKNALSLAIFGALALALGWPLLDAGDSGWLLLSGLLGFAVGDALYFAALPLCGVQIAALSGNLIPPAAALLGWLVLGEVLESRALVAMAVVMTGIVIVLLGKAGGGDASRAPRPVFGFALAAGAALTQSFAIIAGRGAMTDGDGTFAFFMMANVARLAGGVAGAFLIAGLRDGARRERRAVPALFTPLRKGLRGPFAVAALIAAVLNLPLFTYAMGTLPAGISSVLFGTTPLWTLPIGLFLGQRYGAKAWIGSAIAFCGLFVLVDPFGWFATPLVAT